MGIKTMQPITYSSAGISAVVMIDVEGLSWQKQKRLYDQVAAVVWTEMGEFAEQTRERRAARRRA